MQLINSFLTNIITYIQDKRQEAGQTLVEYALIIALISLLVVGLAAVVRGPLEGTFDAIADGLTGGS